MKTTKTGWVEKEKGFTIIEIMIFLAVSAFMFILAAAFINGKQASVAYHQGMLSAGSAIRNIINSVANGEYPALPEGYVCVADKSAPPQFQAGDGTQGGNSGCVFSGKVLQFVDNDANSQYKTFTTVGRQFKTGTDPSDMVLAQSFSEADPKVAKIDGSYLSESNTLQNGLSYSGAYLCKGKCDGSNGNEAWKISGVGFFGSFNDSSGGAVGDEGSGSQTLTMVAMQPTDASMPSLINNSLFFARLNGLSQSPQEPEIVSGGEYVVLCYESGDKQGRVVIGGPGGQQNSVNVEFKGGEPCQD